MNFSTFNDSLPKSESNWRSQKAGDAKRTNSYLCHAQLFYFNVCILLP